MISPEHIRLLLVIASLLMTVGMVIRPFFGVLGYLIIMVSRPGLYYPALGAMRIELVVGLIIIAVMFFSKGKLQRAAPARSEINKYTLMLFGVMGVSMIQAFDFTYSKDWMVEFAKVGIFFMMIVTLAENEKDVKTLMWIFGILMTYIAYQAVYNYHAGFIVESISGDRLDYAKADQGMGSGHVALANLTLQGMPFIWYFTWQTRKTILKAFGILMLLVCFYGVVISGSRGGFVGLVAFYVCLFYLSKKKLLVGAAGLVGAMLLPLLGGEGYMEYMDTILGLFTGGSDVSGSSRITGLRHGFEMLLRRPLLGVGPGCYPLARRAWFGWGLWAHNHYGELMGDLGVIGTIVWFKFLIAYLRRSLSFVKNSENGSSLQALALSIVVATIVRLTVGMGSHSVYIFFWYMLAAVVIVLERVAVIETEKEKPVQEKKKPIPAQGN